MSKYFLTEDRLAELQWHIRQDIPSADDRTKNDPCYLMSSKKIFEMVAHGAGYAIARAENIDEVELVMPRAIFNNPLLAEYILGIVRVEAINLGWSEVKQYNGQYVFISDLYKEPNKKMTRTISKTRIIKAGPLPGLITCLISNCTDLKLEKDARVLSCRIIEVQNLESDLELTVADHNHRVQYIFKEGERLAEFDQERGNFAVMSVFNGPYILTVEYTIADAG